MTGRDAAALVARASSAGVGLSIDGDRVRMRAEAPPPAGLVAELRARKGEVLVYLRSRPVCAECRAPIIEPVRSWWGGEPVHHACGVRAWERDWGGTRELWRTAAPEEPPAAGTAPLEPRVWAAADWRAHFEERLAVAAIDGELPEPEARRQAWQDTVTRWQEAHPGTDRGQATAALQAMVRDEAGAAPTPRGTSRE